MSQGPFQLLPIRRAPAPIAPPAPVGEDGDACAAESRDTAAPGAAAGEGQGYQGAFNDNRLPRGGRSDTDGRDREPSGSAAPLTAPVSGETAAPRDLALPDPAPPGDPAGYGMVPADFTAAQRIWLTTLGTDLLALPSVTGAVAGDVTRLLAARGLPMDDTPWHTPRLSLEARMGLAEGRPLARRLMAAMAQQDCRQCGYVCDSYADAIARGSEARLDLCVPGGKETARMLQALATEAAGGPLAFDAAAHQARAARAAAPAAQEIRPGYHRDVPVAVALKSRRRLGRGTSEKATFHVELDISGTGLEHLPGDTLGIYPENDPRLVDAVLGALQAAPGARVAGRPLRDILATSLSLGTAPDALFTLIACLTGGDRRQAAKRLASGTDPAGAELDVLAALERFPGVRPDLEAFVESLDPLQPRLYSIASSARAQPGVVALTVDHVRYAIDGKPRSGVASSWLAERAPIGTRFRAYLQPAPHFRLPPRRDVPIIMIGPGTGIAPFRAFLQERRMRSESGPAWLFFGHRRQAEDYFYEDELRAFRAQGVLTHLSLAWSRDGSTKTYVQDRLMERGEELWDWLFDGAHIYVCGDAMGMAADVEQALIAIIADHGNRDEDAAAAYLEGLRAAGRYHLDVY